SATGMVFRGNYPVALGHADETVVCRAGKGRRGFVSGDVFSREWREDGRSDVVGGGTESECGVTENAPCPVHGRRVIHAIKHVAAGFCAIAAERRIRNSPLRWVCRNKDAAHATGTALIVVNDRHVVHAEVFTGAVDLSAPAFI